MDESEKTLNVFWENHYVRLNKCLDLRKFEHKFKDVGYFFIFPFKNILFNPVKHLNGPLTFVEYFNSGLDNKIVELND